MYSSVRKGRSERKDANVVHSVGPAGCMGVYRRSIRSLDLNSGSKWGEREPRRWELRELRTAVAKTLDAPMEAVANGQGNKGN